jgi:isocitrate lyase
MRNAEQITQEWATRPRWRGIERPYSADEVVRLRGSFYIEYSLARNGAEQLWDLIHREEYINALGAVTGTQAVQMVAAGLKAIYVSGWQVAGDANTAGQTYPDQSLYPVDSVPALVRRINNALLRADQIQTMEGKKGPYWIVPLIADGEAGFGGILNTYELTKAMIEAGAAAIHYEDQLASAKKCGHLGGKVLVPTNEFIRKLVGARLAADVMDVPTLIVARTDADAATLITSDVDPYDEPFILKDKGRTVEGFYHVRNGVEAAIHRALAYAPYADMLWCETSHPDLEEARQFAEAVKAKYPHKLLFYNCSPSFNWSRNLDAATIAKFQRELGAMGYKFQFITLAGFHSLNYGMFDLARQYKEEGMTAYSRLQDAEFDDEKRYGYRAVKHQAFVGTGYFDALQEVITGGLTSTKALEGSTEAEQFEEAPAPAAPKPAPAAPISAPTSNSDGAH